MSEVPLYWLDCLAARPRGWETRLEAQVMILEADNLPYEGRKSETVKNSRSSPAVCGFLRLLVCKNLVLMNLHIQAFQNP